MQSRHIRLSGALFLILAWCGVARADQLTLRNKTDDQWYAAMYYVAKEGERQGAVIAVASDAEAQIVRPERKIRKKFPLSWYDRNIYLSKQPNNLKKELSQTEIQSLKGLNVGTTSLVGGDSLYLSPKLDGSLGIYREVEWKTLSTSRAVSGAASAAQDALLAPLRAAFKKTEYSKKDANVTTRSAALSQEESDYVQKRRPIVKQAVENFLGKSITDKQVPCIAFCCSGGGYRAMVATIGNFMGLQEIGLLEAATYMVGLSGSTWAIAGWTGSGMSIDDYREQLSKRIGKDLTHGDINLAQVTAALLRKKAFDQPISLIDLYGALLGQKLLKGLAGHNNPNDIHLAQQIERIKDARWIYPIYTSIIAPDRSADPYEWVEYSPYEVGSEYLKTYVPAWGMGRKFLNGKSDDPTPPQPLGYFMGIWGSAFSANLRAMLEEYLEKIPAPASTLLKGVVSTESVGDTRVSPAHMWNITYRMDGKPFQQKKKLTMIDAGLDFNNPLPPLMRPEREVDIIVVFDQSATVVGAPELKKADDYFAKRGIAFPIVDYGKAAHTISVYKHPEGRAPIIIYMPRVGDDAQLTDYNDIVKKVNAWAFTDTTNFAYTPEQVVQLSNLTRDNVVRSKDTLVNAIREVVARRA